MSRFKKIGLAVLSGILLSLPWLNFGTIWIFFALVPLLFIENHLWRNKEANISYALFPYALISFSIWNGLTTYWIGYATLIGAVSAVVINSFLMSLVWWFFHSIRHKRQRRNSFYLLVFAWVAFEYFHLNWDMSWPWLMLGNAFAYSVNLVQWYEYTGTLGGTVWVLLSNIFILNFLLDWTSGKEQLRKKLIALVAIIVLPSLSSLIILKNNTCTGDEFEVVVLQPNIDPYHEKFDRMSPNQQYMRLFHLADSLGSEKTTLFVAPETALHQISENDLDGNSIIKRLKKYLNDKFPDATFVIGASSHYVYGDDEEPSATARYLSNGKAWDAYNAALKIKPDEPTEVYHKNKLVAGVEKIPYSRYMKFLNRLVVDLGGTTGELATNNRQMNFAIEPNINAVPLICYESVYGEYLTEFVRKGGNVVVLITNDGWWKNSPGYQQHMAFARLRAIEIRRSIIRSANTGISAIINSRGQVVEETLWWEQTGIRAEVKPCDKLTVYARYGDFIGRMSAFIMVFVLLGLLSDKIKNRIS